MHVQPTEFSHSFPWNAAWVRLIRVIFCLAAIHHGSIGVQAAGGPGELLTTEGTVEHAAASGNWKPASPGLSLVVGDRIRTGEFSRATLRLPAGSVLRIDELTTLKVVDGTPSGGRFRAAIERGGVYFFSRTRPEEMDFTTPVATGAIRGTEVAIRVGERGESSFAVLNGEVSVTPAAAPGGAATLSSGEAALVQGNGSLARIAVLDAVAPIQWALYYPAVLDPASIQLPSGSGWQQAWQAYQNGALPAAIRLISTSGEASTDSERLLSSALMLASGRYTLTEIRTLGGEQADALRLFAAVAARGSTAPETRSFTPSSATGWLAWSYARQSAGDIGSALEAALNAVRLSPDFGYAWSRVAELKFASGRRKEAEVALIRAVDAAPALTSALSLRGFVAAADGRRTEAEGLFLAALAKDSAFAPARLGLGILAHASGEVDRGRRELIAAAALDPIQSLPRSYLAKSWLEQPDLLRASAELAIAERLDPRDPTPALYGAVLAQRTNRPNAAVVSLERSLTLNDNRRIYRSRLLLDEDRAIRRANLAAMYRSAGAEELGFREASRAVLDDPSNFSAHLFLANAYDEQRDPLRINLRYETPWSGSLLMARLLAPVGAGALAPSVGLNEYSALFEPRRFTFEGETVWLDSGEWRQTIVHTGNLGRTHYALEGRTLHFEGYRANQDFEQVEVTALASHQITPDDTVTAQAYFQDVRGGDLRVSAPTNVVDLEGRFRERQLPLANVGYRHRWRPGSETLLLGARLETDFRRDDPISLQEIVVHEPTQGTFTRLFSQPMDSLFRNRFVLGHAELTHMEQRDRWGLQAGFRFQQGTFTGENRLEAIAAPFGLLASPAADVSIHEDFQRSSGYIYGTWRPTRRWSVLVGVAGDRIVYPANLFTEPVTAGQDRASRISPKVGVVWEPNDRWTVRAAHSESLGGITFEESFRLEPVQFAGFTQGVRSLIPEAVAGATVAPRFRLDGVGISARWPGSFYFNLEAEQRTSEARRLPGVFVIRLLPARPESLRESLSLRETHVSVSAHWMVTPRWTVTFGSQWLDAEFEQVFPESPGFDFDQHSKLLAPFVRLMWNSPSGWFLRMETTWRDQRNESAGRIPDERNAWDTSMQMGYRARSLRWSSTIGVMNGFDDDLAFDALTVPLPLQLERAFFVRATWSL